MLNSEIFTKRLKELMDYYELSASKLADSIGIQRSGISHLLSGRNKPSLDFVLKILDTYPEVRFEWLVYGKGSLGTDETIDTSPTLFDTPVREKKKELNNPERVSDTPKNIQMNKSEIERVILFYKGGYFKEYTEK